MLEILVVAQPTDQFIFSLRHGVALFLFRLIRVVPDEEHRYNVVLIVIPSSLVVFIIVNVNHPLDLALFTVPPVLVLVDLYKDFVRPEIVLNLFFLGMAPRTRILTSPSGTRRWPVFRGQYLDHAFLTEFLMTLVPLVVHLHATKQYAQTLSNTIDPSTAGAFPFN